MKNKNYVELRRHKRIKVHNGIAITPHGVCQLVDLNMEGVSFKCMDEHDFPGEWSMAIYDTKGHDLEQLQVKKVWETSVIGPPSSPHFSKEIGGKFHNLSYSQKVQISAYLQNLKKDDYNT